MKREPTLKQKKSAFAKELRKKIIPSEQWFMELYKPYRLTYDEFNVLFGGYIPDVINKQYKYIIEVDGSIHNLKRIQLKDKRKDNRFISLGYKVFRIKAYDMESFFTAIKQLQDLRGTNYKPAKIYTKAEIENLKPTNLKGPGPNDPVGCGG